MVQPSGPDFLARSGVVRGGDAVVEVVVAGAAVGRVVLYLNGKEAAVADLDHVPAGGVVTLRAALPPVTDLTPLAPRLTFDAGEKSTPIPRGSGFFLDRLDDRDFESFRTSIMRKHMRIADRTTLIYAAERAARRFEGKVLEVAVALAVIGYRYVENIDGVKDADLAGFRSRVEAFRKRLDPADPAEARWITSVDVMLMQIFCVRRDHAAALHLVNEFFEHRHLVRVEPMCAFNLMIGIVLKGYIHFIRKEHDAAIQTWKAWDDVFTQAAVNMPRTFGPLREFAFIREMSEICVTGITLAQGGSRERRAGELNDAMIAERCLRVTTAKARRRMAAFLADLRGSPALAIDPMMDRA